MWLLVLFSVSFLANFQATPAREDLFFLQIEEQNITEASSNETAECQVGTDKLCCLCGEKLELSHKLYRDRLRKTCSTYDVVRGNSPFSFCDGVMQSLGYDIRMGNVSMPMAAEVNESSYLNQSRLTEIVQSLESSVDMYKRILDRTLVGVLIETEEHRCSCFDNYKKWLCTTRLGSFYHLPSSSPSLQRIKPCISICYDVLQNCPYYLPSQYQRDNELIYGGYPAFDCPAHNTACIGSNGACYRGGYSIVLFSLSVTYFLVVWSVT